MARSRQSSIRKTLSSNIQAVAQALGQFNAVGDVVTNDISAAGAQVGFGSICRIEVAEAAATLDLTTDIILTSTTGTDARITNTFTLQVIAAAANPIDTILAVWSGTAAAMVLTITPNDGTNNGAVPVAMTTAELVEYINTGDIAAKTGQVSETDASGFRDDQIASGGDATALADAGEGDGEVATFSSGDIYVAFGDATIGAVTSTSTPAIKLEAGKFYNIVATDDYIRSNTAVPRLEVVRTQG